MSQIHEICARSLRSLRSGTYSVPPMGASPRPKCLEECQLEAEEPQQPLGASGALALFHSQWFPKPSLWLALVRGREDLHSCGSNSCHSNEFASTPEIHRTGNRSLGSAASQAAPACEVLWVPWALQVLGDGCLQKIAQCRLEVNHALIYVIGRDKGNKEN